MIILSLRRGDEDKLIDELIWKSLWMKKEREVNKGKKQTKIQFFRMKESQINFVNSSASKKKLHSQAGNKLNQARKIKSIFIMIQERTNLSFFLLLPFSCNLCWRVVRQRLAFFKFDVYSYPQCPANSHISPLTGSLRFFHISTFLPCIFQVCSPIFHKSPISLRFLSNRWCSTVLYTCHRSLPPPVFLLQLYSAFPFEIFVEISY